MKIRSGLDLIDARLSRGQKHCIQGDISIGHDCIFAKMKSFTILQISETKLSTKRARR